METIEIGPATRVTKDEKSGAIRSWFDTSAIPQAEKSFVPRATARSTLEQSASLFNWKPNLPDLKDAELTKGQNTYGARFTQDFKGIPVDSSEVVVNMYSDGRVYSIYNQYHYDIPSALNPQKIKIQQAQAREIVARYLKEFRRYEASEGVLIVYQYHRTDTHSHKGGPVSAVRTLLASLAHREAAQGPKEGDYYLAWDFRVITREPALNLRFLVDAMTAQLINIVDLSQYASGNASVFDPNPVVTSGNTGLSWGTPIATLDGERVPVTVDRLNAADGGGNFHLDGSLVQMEEFENPAVAEPVSGAANFAFSSNQDSFLDAMAYFHIDRFQNYIQTVLAINNAGNFSIGVDPQGLENQGDNSHYLPLTKKIAFGARNPNPGGVYNPVPDAADAMVILHEYGHALQDNMLPGFSGFSGGVGEGFGDFLAAVYYDDKHKTPANTRGIMMSFDANTTDAGWPGRSYNKKTKFDENAFTSAGGYGRAEVWASTMFELYRKLGGDSQYSSVKAAARDLAIRLHIMATFNVPVTGSTVADWGQQIQAADGNLGGWRYANGLHKKVIYDTYRLRHLTGFTDLPVDVYINDGRSGGYGSLSGNDLFSEKQFLDNYWSTQDLWVRVLQYANDNDQQSGDPGDHVEPPVNSTAYLYVRVKNKGTSDSGSVTVKAYHSDPTIGLVWPTDWTPTDTPSLTFANIPAGGKHVFGPFPWTPAHVGHECVFAVVECANDHAITQDLPAMTTVSHADLVPFDNNIAQRNLYPTAAKGKMVRGFWVSNPNFERSVVTLNFESTLPQGWTYHTNLASTAIDLAGRERRWVEVTIDQASGPEITDFTNPPAITIAGTIGGRLIGGMSFYAAPPSAFPAPPHKEPPCEVIRPSDLFCLNIPWKDCEIEGELDIKLRFRCCKDKK